MRLTPVQLSAQLARGLAPLYVVAGEEPLLVQESLDAIRASARAAGYSEREVLHADKGYNWQGLADSCASLSLFASRRIVEIHLAGAGPGEEGGRLLQQLAARPPPDVLLLVVAGPLDSRARNAAWYLRLEEAGASVYAWPLKPAEFPGWIEARLRQAGLSAEPEALRLLAERTEGNLLACAQDIEKLRLLHPGQRLDEAQLAAAVADSARYIAFDLNDRVLDGDAAGCARSLARLREEGVAVLEVLGALLWCVRQLARAAPVYARTRDLTRACEAGGVRRAQQDRFRKALSRTRPAEPLGWLRRAARVDQLAKSTQGEQAAWEELLTLALAASGAAQPHRP
ncbi:MAG: DNA polymerase III subunit delta [Gammaproteobacteria bacterium]